jgi:hypothetical protein
MSWDRMLCTADSNSCFTLCGRMLTWEYNDIYHLVGTLLTHYVLEYNVKKWTFTRLDVQMYTPTIMKQAANI